MGSELLEKLVTLWVVIDALGIGLNSFQVAGGIVLFLFALIMTFGDSKPEQERKEVEENAEEPDAPIVGIFPLAVPSLASLGAMLAIVMMTDSTEYKIPDQALPAFVMQSAGNACGSRRVMPVCSQNNAILTDENCGSVALRESRKQPKGEEAKYRTLARLSINAL
ncbi:MAG: MarC family protein [Marinosulfonomonas sp.]